MSAALKVPTIFTAVDKFSKVVENMQKSVGAFAGKTDEQVARVQRSFRKVSAVSKQVAAGTAIAGTAIMAPLAVATNNAVKYEDSIASLSAITGATGAQLDVFKKKVEDVGDATGKSYTDVAKAFELAGSAIPELLGNADALGAVSKAAIVLSKASREDTESSIRSLTGVMNQFSLGADQAQRTINVLAAGAKVGAASISQTSEAMVNFGSVAAGANMSVEQAVSIIQVLSKYGQFGAESGTKLRGSILKLQQAGVGYASGQFKINDALAEAKVKIDKLATAKQKDAAILKMFGAENIATGKILLNNIGLFQEYTAGVTSTNEATIQAGINQAAMAQKMEVLKNNLLNVSIKIGEVLLPILSQLADKILPIIVNISSWVKENPKLTATIVKTAAAIGVILLVLSGLASAIAVVTGAVATFETLGVAVVAVSGFFSNTLFPILEIIWAVFTTIIEVMAAAAGVTTGVFLGIAAAIGFVISLVLSFIRNWDMIVKAFKTEGLIAGFKAIGKTILDAILLPLQKILELASHLPKFLGGGLAGDAAVKLSQFRTDMGVNPVVNTKKTNQDAVVSRTENTQTKNVIFDFKNVPKGLSVSGDGASGSMIPSLTPTFAM